MLTMNMESPGFWMSGSSWRAAELAAVWLVTPTGFLVVAGLGGVSFSRPANRCLLDPPCPTRQHVSMPQQELQTCIARQCICSPVMLLILKQLFRQETCFTSPPPNPALLA